MIEAKIPDYPTIRFMLKWRAVLIGILALAPVAAGGYLYAQTGAALYLPGGLFAGFLVWLFLSSYFEVLHIVSDTLMPR